MPIDYHYGRFPPDDRLDWPRLIPLLSPTSAAVARYDGMLSAIPNPEILLAPLTTEEAVLSSRIEGTQATVEEVLGFEAGRVPDSPEQRLNIFEVLNYRNAMRDAKQMLGTLPLSQRVIRETHSKLLSGVRGEGKSPGEYRRKANWIGPPDCTIEEAKFVPISAEELPTALNAWETYIHEVPSDRLVQLAIIHAEFESLHPFQDGNGRMGRMLVPLFLWQFGLIREPMFYISAYLEAQRDAYYAGLFAVSRDDDWTGWVAFFLEAVRKQAENNLGKTRGILDLYEKTKDQVAEMTRSQYAIRTLDAIFEKPIFGASDFSSTAGIPKASAQRILGILREGGILKVFVPGSGRQSNILVFPELLNIAEGRDIF